MICAWRLQKFVDPFLIQEESLAISGLESRGS